MCSVVSQQKLPFSITNASADEMQYDIIIIIIIIIISQIERK